MTDVDIAAAAADASLSEPTGEVETQAAEELVAVGSLEAEDDASSGGGDHKRKLDNLEPFEHEDETPLKKKEVSASDGDEAGSGGGGMEADDAGAEVEPSSLDGGQVDEAEVAFNAEAAEGVDIDSKDNGVSKQDTTNAAVNAKTDAEEEHHDNGVNGSDMVAEGQFELQNSGQHDGNAHSPSTENIQDTSASIIETVSTSRRIEVLNNKVGVLIGKAGDTIKSLQHNSGAKIQITRDSEADPQSLTRSVELIGTPESINKAEKLIKDVIAEADAGGSPSLVARGFGTLQSGGDETEIKVPNEKVGLIIGKGGEMIRNLQTKSGARIQLIPQQLPEGDLSKERTVRITGNKKQIEIAKEMIKEVMNQTHMRSSTLSGGSSQQNFHPWRSASQPQWGPQLTNQPTMGSGYQQRGRYQSPQATPFTQPHGAYPHQPPPRGNFGAGWDQRPAAGYDYYGQGSQPTGTVNYNSGSQGPNYGHTPYAQPAPSQQNYGQGYNEPKYDSQGQQYYGQQPMGMQSGPYGQQMGASQTGYSQYQSFGKPIYGIPTQGAPPSYGSNAPPQQSYPFGSTVPPQQSTGYNQAYGPASGVMDGYTQQPAAYSQQSGQSTAAYVQGGGGPMPYSQPTPSSGGYAQYPPSQQSYGDPAASNAVYAGYAQTAPTTGYGTSATQPGYVQQSANPSGYYDQAAQTAAGQAGYGSHPGSAPVA